MAYITCAADSSIFKTQNDVVELLSSFFVREYSKQIYDYYLQFKNENRSLNVHREFRWPKNYNKCQLLGLTIYNTEEITIRSLK